MKFKTTEPSLREIMLLSLIDEARMTGSPDFPSICELILSRLEPGQLTLNGLVDAPVSQVLTYFTEALESVTEYACSAAAFKKGHNVDQVALSSDEKERLSKLMEQMREKRASRSPLDDSEEGPWPASGVGQ